MSNDPLYPPCEPHSWGHLAVGDGHQIYWEECGNPAGKPALVLHGGPGSGCTPGWRRYFDPMRYRVILMDQRGCGRSRPHAGDTVDALAANTTAHLIADIEQLRRHLGIQCWLVLGASWGSTLALAYAARHAECVREMVLFSIATTTSFEIDWITRGVGIYFPAAWERFRDALPAHLRDGDIATAYHRLLIDPDPATQERAARAWCDWEAAIVALRADQKPHPRYADPRFRLGFARLVTLYWSQRAWLADGELLAAVEGLGHVPAVLIHGRVDLCNPLVTPWRLARAWPEARLVTIDQGGHDAGDEATSGAIVAALDGFARS
ncbi:proline iminopeptidase [Dongia mobilis]|uniref:Proline iminopeptidase n=1 Tax=Dongia mobilis TaxID=578943 RepID=A0A4R6WNM0_9PROT|nr:prolyl aminopeptidase [Dongia mobilis]TDQ80900.1 proline iminopeptidase [Dongia mobilis]